MGWKEISPPARKKDYIFKPVRLKKRPSAMMPGISHVDDVIFMVARRLNAKETGNSIRDVSCWGDIRLLDLEYACPCCGTLHRVYIPEGWIAEGRAVFVVEEANT